MVVKLLAEPERHMSTIPEERFLHLVTCIWRLHSALDTLRLIRVSAPENPLISPAFRFALVEYASCFTRSYGKLLRYSLDEKHVPSELIDLHKRLISARHKIHAHSDLTIMNAEFKATGSQAKPTAEIRSTYIDELNELPNIDRIIALINETIHNLYIEREAQLKALNA